MTNIEDAIRSNDPATALESMGQLLRIAEGIEKCRYTMELLRAGVQMGKELDQHIAKKNADLAASNERAMAEGNRVALDVREKMIGEARAEAKRILDDANTQAAAVNAELKTKQAELDGLVAEIATVKKRLRTHIEELSQRLTPG